MSNNYNSDGYIMIDLSDVDVTKSTQNVPGIYSRILNVIDTNKLILVVNHKGLTPQAAICNKLLNYYVITTNLYIYKINSNDIVIIEQAGSSSVEVSIIPTLMSGTKIADFAIGSVEGSLYAPEFETEINDNVTASNSTWSSEKIDDELELKADAADLATVATSGSYADLTNKPTIPTKTSDLTNDSGFITDADVPVIDDTTTAIDKVWSSDKTSDELALKADATAVYTKTEVDTALSLKQNATDNSLTTTNKTVVGAINEIKSNIDFNSYNAVNWGSYRGSFSVTGGQWNTIANGNVRDVNSFTSKTDNKITLPDDSLYMVFANVSTSDGTGLVGLIATDNNTELATFLYNKITGQSNKYMGYWVITGAQNKEISLKVFAQGSGITATVEIDVVRISLSRDTN